MAQGGAATDTAYSFQAEPRAVNTGRRKYRGMEEGVDTQVGVNIMFDRRVVRGNTYGSQVLPKNAQMEALEKMEAQKHEQAMRTHQARLKDSRARPLTPEAVEGRKHIDVQTDNYLEELDDKMPEASRETQTDPYMDRPPSPLFMPTKQGVDVETQIEDGDLFDFNLEVEPILEVLVGKALEQSMMEVLEEEELQNIIERQEMFERTRNAELAEVQRMEAEQKRRYDEKDRRVEQEKQRIEKERQVREKVTARSFAKSYLSDLHANVFNSLLDSGHFYDTLVKEVEDQFMPWLLDQVVDNLSLREMSKTFADDAIEGAISAGCKQYEDEQERLAIERKNREREEARLEEARKKKEEEEARLAEEAARAEEEEENEEEEDS